MTTIYPLSELPTDALCDELKRRCPRGCLIAMLEPPLDAIEPGNKINFALSAQYDSKDSFCRMKGQVDWYFTVETVAYHTAAMKAGEELGGRGQLVECCPECKTVPPNRDDAFCQNCGHPLKGGDPQEE